MKIVICDIDGTLSDATHRLHFLEQTPKDWDAFYRMCILDTVHEDIADLIRLFYKQHFVYMFSGRREATRKDTEYWLKKHNIPFTSLYLRSDGFIEKTTSLKKKCYTH